MKRWIWPVIALVAVFVLGVVVALSLSDHAEQRAVIRAQAQTSAAMSITLFLAVVILTLVLLAGGVIIGGQWWKRRQRQAKMQDALAQAQIYSLLNGARLPAGGRPTARPSIPAQQAGGSNVIIVPGQQNQPQPTLADFRAMIDTMQRKEAGGLPEGMRPPDDWRVVG
ncbi:MAG: hypothetical protein SWK90_14275 [Chloroflexota bacterium]|nr:hypothetical protein [Chloroflexota bacterium]